MSKWKFLKDNIENLLTRDGLSPTDLSDRAKIPRATIQKILNGSTKNARHVTLEKIAKFFHISIQDLITTNALRQSQQQKAVPLIKRSEIASWLAQKYHTSTDTPKIAVSRNISEKAFAIICNEANNPTFKSGSHLIFDPAIKPADGSYVLIKPFDHDEFLLRQISIDVGVSFVKPLSSQFNSANKIRDDDAIVATLLQIQINFEEN